MPKRLGLIAGNRDFPLHVARAAKTAGYTVIAVGLREETSSALEQEVDKMHWVTLSDVGKVPALLRDDEIKEVILAGQVQARRLLDHQRKLDGLTAHLMKLVPDRSGDSAMKMGVRILESYGFKVLHSGVLLKHWLPDAGVLTDCAPTADQKGDLKLGLKLSRQLSKLHVGQTIIVEQGAVVAVEAIEGTDEAIQRAGRYSGGKAVVIKACGPDHDMRFDIPVVGQATLDAMTQAGIHCLGVEAGRTLLFDRPEFIAQANQKGLCIVAL